MDGELTCEDCGGRLQKGAAKPGGWVRCPTCGGGARVPPDAITTEQHAASYCPECGAEMQAGAVLCVHCGYHRGQGKRLKTRRKRARRVWESRKRATDWIVLPIAVVLLLCMCGLFSCGVLFVSQGGWVAFLLLVLVAAGGAWLLIWLGSRFRLVLERDEEGRFRLTRREWWFLIPVSHWSIRLDESDKAFLDYFSHGQDRWGREHGYYTLSVAGDRQHAPYVLYRGYDEEFLHDIADGLRDVAGVQLERR